MDTPSELVLRHTEALREAAARGPVVDLACGRGRNALALARRGVPVVGVDRSAAHLSELVRSARAEALPVNVLRADLERAPHPPLAPGRCAALVVCRYLHRPLAARLPRLLLPGGWLLYETFTIHQRDLGHGPRNPDFLLEPGELPGLFPGLEIAEHEEGFCGEAARRQALARIAARLPFETR